jgi:hypothetical protein
MIDEQLIGKTNIFDKSPANISPENATSFDIVFAIRIDYEVVIFSIQMT